MHARAKPNSEASLRLPSLPRRIQIVERIMAEAILPSIVRKYRERAQFTYFCGAQPHELVGYEGQLEVVGRCLEWFVFDYVIPEFDQTPAQLWFSTNAENLSADDRADARDCLKFILGLFEIGVVEPGRGFIALDILRSPLSYAVGEENVSQEIRPGQLLLGRIFPHRGGHALSGMAAIMNRSATAQIKDLIADGKINPTSVLSDLDGLQLENLVSRNGHDIRQAQCLEMLQERLKRYLHICASGIAFEQLWDSICQADDPITPALQLAEQLNISASHEMELFFAIINTAWSETHK